MNSALKNQLTSARQASYGLQDISTSKKNALLKTLAAQLIHDSSAILKANAKDFASLPADYGLADRLRLTKDRIMGMSDSLLAVTTLADPLGEVLEKSTQPSGITVSRVRVPVGVLGVIYEARPNVTIEIFSLCFKTGNAVILKGSRDAYYTNQALLQSIRTSLKKHSISIDIVQLIDPFKRELTTQLLTADGLVDIIIPRGSDRLIEFVRKTATVPTIETGAGVCHTYVERTANIAQAVRIIVNAKTRRCTVCNSLDTVVVDASITAKLCSALAPALSAKNVIIYADQASYAALQSAYPKRMLRRATKRHFGKEFLALTLSIKTVKDNNEAIDFIQSHTSGHSEAIITTNKTLANRFTREIDAAAVYVNTSTAFTDGFEFGLGAEVGISTQKLHARGPMGLTALTTYKWIVTSAGQIRQS